MRAVVSKRFQYSISIAVLIALVWLSSGAVIPAEAGEEYQSASDPVIAAAGDIACDPASESFNEGDGNENACRQKYTSDLLLNTDLAAVLPLGDIQYHCGGYEAFLRSYDLSWGRVKNITRPVVGNHEYLTSNGTGCTIENEGAAGYFKYFGAAAGDPSGGYYSYDIGEWHLIALNSNCGDAGGCDIGSPQYQWLEADLATHPNLCTLAYWHIPLFSSGGRDNDNTRPFWQLLYRHGVELVLSGHDHIYERFAPQTADGTLDPVGGIREFVVGTGGSNHTSITAVARNSEVRNSDTYGVLLLTLHADSYDWQFVPEAGYTFTDSGTEKCHTSAGNSSSNAQRTSTPSPTPQPTTAFTFTPVADTYVSQTKPMINYGASNMLRIYGEPAVQSFVRFNVEGLPGPVARATLRFYSHTRSNSGYEVRTVLNNSWEEATLTYQNAPPLGGALAHSGRLLAGQWVTVDVTSLVTGNGTFSIALTTSGDTAFSLASRNAISAHVPQLVVDVIADPNASLIQTPLPFGTATAVPDLGGNQQSNPPE